MRTAIIQSNAKPFDIDFNTQSAIDYIAEAKENNADFVLFPECFLTSYCFPDILETMPDLCDVCDNAAFKKWCTSALSADDIHIRKIQQAAKAYRINIEITAFTKGHTFPRNTAFIIDRNGEIVLEYSKVHTCDFSLEKYVECGSEFKVCIVDGIHIGTMICYDREYPESARELMLLGAELIMVPNSCRTMKPRLMELSVRAMENMCGVAMANPPGTDKGNSCAYSPIVWSENGGAADNEIVVADELFSGIIYADFDMDKIRDFRNREDLGKYRKPLAYKNL